MKKIGLDDLTPGMKLHQPIFSQEGKVLLAEGTTLYAPQIAIIEEAGFPCVYIASDANETEGLIGEENYSAILQLLYLLEQEVREGKMTFALFKEPLFTMVDEVMKLSDRLFSVPAVRLHEAYIFDHSVNVTLLSLLIGRSLHYDTAKMRELAVCALLHDVGMFLIPRNILQKKGPLSQIEQRQMEEHTMLGFQFLQAFQETPRSVPSIVYQHHERLDGSGYPRSLNGRSLLEMSRIVGVADVFDAMTSERIYRSAFRPSQVLGYLRDNSGFLFDSSIVEALMKNIATYPVGSKVRLNNSRKALVKAINPRDGNRPIVQDAEGDLVFDLAAHPDLAITEELSLENVGLLKLT